MSRLVIHRDRERECWLVFRIADEDGSRVLARFDSLLEAEQFIIGTPRCAGRAAVAHEPTLMAYGRCPVCGEAES